LVTLSPRRLAEQPVHFSHNTVSKCPAQGLISRSQAAWAERRQRRPSAAEAPPMAAERCRWQPSSRAADGGRAPQRPSSSAEGCRASQMVAKLSQCRPSAADGGRAQSRRWRSAHRATAVENQEQADQALEREMWREDEIWHKLRKCWSSSRRPQRWR
jgi:hypothetical protein